VGLSRQLQQRDPTPVTKCDSRNVMPMSRAEFQQRSLIQNREGNIMYRNVLFIQILKNILELSIDTTIASSWMW